MGRNVGIGIDLGTTYSRVGVWKNDCVKIIPNSQGNRATPSFVAFVDGQRLVGEPGKAQAAPRPENVVFNTKRLIGQSFTDPIVQSDTKLWPFKVVSVEGDAPMIMVNFQGEEKTFRPEEISAMLLLKLKEAAEAFLGRKVVDAVVTVPAHFDDFQRQATIDAGTLAGLNVLRIINEHAAAAIAHGLTRGGSGKRNILVYDMGGGTTDVSLLTIGDGVFEVKATAGDRHLGGEDLDGRLVDYCMRDFKLKNHGMDIAVRQRSVRRLRTQCERAKRTLSSHCRAIIEIDSLFEGVDYWLSIGRALFEELNMDYFRRCRGLVEECLRDSGFEKCDVHEVVLVGGSSRIPKVQYMLEDFFQGTGTELCKSINPDESVTVGAAVQAAILTGAGSSRVGASALPGVCLRDVTSLSVKLEAPDGKVATLVERNTTIPTSRTFITFADNQPGLPALVLVGRPSAAGGDAVLGRFLLHAVPPAPHGAPQIEVTVEIDANGVLKVSAQDASTGAQIVVTDTRGHGPSRAEMERMLQEAEEWQRKDAKDYLAGYCASILSALEWGVLRDRLESLEKERVQLAVQDTLDWLDTHQLSHKCEFETEQKELELLVDLPW